MNRSLSPTTGTASSGGQTPPTAPSVIPAARQTLAPATGLAAPQSNPLREPPSFRVLLVDDNSAIHNDYKKILTAKQSAFEALDAGMFGETEVKNVLPKFEISSAYQGQEALEMVRQACQSNRPYALAFVDVRMPPGWDGIETVQHIWEVDPEIQVVISTAFSDYSWSEMVNVLGKTDRFVILKKPFDVIEIQQLAYSLTEKWQLSQKVKAHVTDLESLVNERTAQLQQSLSLLNATLESTGDGILAVDNEGTIINQNAQFARFWNLPPEIVESRRNEVVMGVIAQQLEKPQAFLEKIEFLCGQFDATDFGTFKLKDSRTVELLSQPQKLNDQIIGRIFNFRDATKRELVADQLRQAQKMETIGQLAGGIAHDFNNLLTVIQGHATLISNPELGPAVNESINEIMEAAEKAASLTRQLLTFSRRQIMQMADLNVNDTINDISRVIRRMVGDDIHLKLDLASDVPTVRADRAMLEQVLMNLASNARDAMPRGGTLTVQTRMMTLEESYFGGEKIPAGTYARLSVADTGFGISPEHLPRIFEPFFTTKSVGQGSGLGLATVYGAIKQHQGAIKVETTPGRGTTFTMLFPIAKQKKQVTNELKTSISGRRIAGGAETILVVEDDAAILQMVRALLAGYGYRVLEASSALDALGIWRSQKGKINLLLTDVVMGGGFAGRELAAKLREDEPNLKVIFTSGYADVPERDAALKDAPNFIAKPYHPAKLAQAVRSILDN